MGTEEGKPASELGEGEDDSTLVTGGGRAGDDDKDGITEQNAAAGGGGGANSSPDEGGIALVGGVGSDFVSRALSTFAPQEAVHDIQQKTRVTDERCEPVFGLLRQVGRSRAEVNRSLLASLTQLLLRRVKQLDPSRQEEAALDLLEKSFIYIRIPEVRCIPIAVLEHLRAIPNNFLKQLSADPIVFETLPASVKRQVWELDKSLLQQRVSPLVAEYGGEAESAEALLDLGVCGKYKLRQQHRARSQALKQVSAILDRSTKIYKYVVNLVLTLYRESERSYLSREELSLCAFRSQLLMQLHDAQNELRQQDPCHRLAWVLDQALRDGECGDRRVNELVQVMRPYDKQQHQGGRGRKRGRGDHHHHADPHGGGSTSQPDESTALGEMGMVLRDPPIFAFLAGTCYDRLRQVVKLERVPKQDFNLVFLTRLLQVGRGFGTEFSLFRSRACGVLTCCPSRPLTASLSLPRSLLASPGRCFARNATSSTRPRTACSETFTRGSAPPSWTGRSSRRGGKWTPDRQTPRSYRGLPTLGWPKRSTSSLCWTACPA